MTRQQLFAAFFFAVFLFLLFQFYRMFQGFLAPLAWAALLAFIFYPLQTRLTRLARGRDGWVAFALTTAVILVVMVPTVLLVILVANESVAVYQRTAEFVAGQDLQVWLDRLRGSALGGLWDRLAGLLAVWKLDLRNTATGAANAASGFLMGQVTFILKNVAVFVVDFFLTTFALFFFFRDGRRMVAAVAGLLPMEGAHKEIILDRLHETLSAVVQGTLMTAVAQGVVAGIGYGVIGVPFAVFLGCATAFASLLPFGAPLVWGSVAVYLAMTASVARTVALVLWGMLAIGSIDNFVRPLVIGGRTNIPTVVLFFAILGGLKTYGFLGIFLAPVVVGMLVAFVRIYREQYGGAQ